MWRGASTAPGGETAALRPWFPTRPDCGPALRPTARGREAGRRSPSNPPAFGFGSLPTTTATRRPYALRRSEFLHATTSVEKNVAKLRRNDIVAARHNEASPHSGRFLLNSKGRRGSRRVFGRSVSGSNVRRRPLAGHTSSPTRRIASTREPRSPRSRRRPLEPLRLRRQRRRTTQIESSYQDRSGASAFPLNSTLRHLFRNRRLSSRVTKP